MPNPNIIQEREEEKQRLRKRLKNLETGCATCGSNENHDVVTDKGRFTHQFDDGIDAKMFNEDDFNNQTLHLLLSELIRRIEEAKEAVREQTGSVKYDSCYDDSIAIIKEYIK